MVSFSELRIKARSDVQESEGFLARPSGGGGVSSKRGGFDFEACGGSGADDGRGRGGRIGAKIGKRVTWHHHNEIVGTMVVAKGCRGRSRGGGGGREEIMVGN